MWGSSVWVDLLFAFQFMGWQWNQGNSQPAAQGTLISMPR